MMYNGTPKWIWPQNCGGDNAYARFSVTVPGESGKWVLRLTSDYAYAFYVNGQLCGLAQCAAYPGEKLWDEWDLTSHLTRTENVLDIECRHMGVDCADNVAESAGLIYEILHDGVQDTCSSEHTPSARLAGYDPDPKMAWVTPQLGYTYFYDSRVKNAELSASLVADKPLPVGARAVKPLQISEDAACTLPVCGSFRENGGDTAARRMQKAYLAFGRTDMAARLPGDVLLQADENADGVFAVADLGTESTGVLSLDVELPCDAEVLIGWGEHLEDLRVRTYVGTRNFGGTYYGHAGRNRFLAPFHRMGLRYLQIFVCAPSARIRYAGIRSTEYPLSHESYFTCADQLHTRIYEVSKRTLRMCMHEHYEDCPWREQALYSMDSRNQMLCGYYAFGETAFPKESIRLMAGSIREDDLLELCSPGKVFVTIPSFTAIFLTQVYEYLCYSQDREFVRGLVPVLERIADGFIRRLDPQYGLLKTYPRKEDWNFYEWQDGLEGNIGKSSPEDQIVFEAPLCAFVSFGLRSLAGVMEILGEAQKAAYYREKHLHLNAAMNACFWDAEKKVYASFRKPGGELFHYSELTNSLIVYADAAEEHLTEVLEALTGNALLECTISHSIFKYEALMRRKEKYARFVFADIARQWGHMLYHGATTFWETIRGASDFGNAGSLCHGWSAVPIYFYHKYAMQMDGSETGLYECRLTSVQEEIR